MGNCNKSHDRVHAIDFTKGVLVITMVAYHIINYFLPTFNVLFAYLSFVTWGFIFYAGFMCGTIYFKRYIVNKEDVYKRLSIRGLKLILLYTIINLLIYIFIKSNEAYIYFNSRSVYDNFVLIFLFGGGKQFTDFNVLLPIAYTLLIGSPLIGLHKFKYSIYFVLISVFALLSFINVNSNIINNVLTGILGVFTGLIFNELRPKLFITSTRYMGLLFLILFLFFVVPYEPRSYLLAFITYIILVIYNLHSLSMLTASFKTVTFIIDKLGQYSLFLYIAQIAILQVLQRTISISSSSITIDHVLIFIFVNVFLLVLCYLLDYLRKKITFMDKTYRFIFS